MTEPENVEVKIVHLITGAPIIAKVHTVNQGCVYVLEDPLYLMYNQEESLKTGKDTFGTNKLLALSDETQVKIDKDRVLFAYYPSKNLLDHYNDILTNMLELLPVESE